MSRDNFRTTLATPRRARRPVAPADDGDELRFCSTCAFSSACRAEGLDKSELRELHVLVEHVGPYAPGAHLFREGDPFLAIAAVRSGTVKTCVVDREGHEQVLGFHFPGEVIGLNAIDPERHPCSAVAIDAVSLCRFSFPKMAVLARRLPGLQAQLFRLLSRDIGHAALLADDHSAAQRLAAFLVRTELRLSAEAQPAGRYRLVMPRTDIANYLRLAPETVSRVLRHFQDQGVLRVRGRNVQVLDRMRLQALAAPALRV